MSENTNVRVLPLPVPHPVWREGSKYPDEMKVSFRDGKVRSYRICAEQPVPQVISREELERMTAENPEAYGYKPKHAKK